MAFYGHAPEVLLLPEMVSVHDAMGTKVPRVDCPFVLLDVQIDGFRPAWLDEMQRDYTEVRRLMDPRDPSELKVVVFQSKPSLARRPGADAR